VKHCAECQQPFAARGRGRYGSDRCRYKRRDRLDYQRDPEGERAKALTYYRTHREQVLAKAAARTAARRAEREAEGQRRADEARNLMLEQVRAAVVRPRAVQAHEPRVVRPRGVVERRPAE